MFYSIWKKFRKSRPIDKQEADDLQVLEDIFGEAQFHYQSLTCPGHLPAVTPPAKTRLTGMRWMAPRIPKTVFASVLAAFIALALFVDWSDNNGLRSGPSISNCSSGIRLPLTLRPQAPRLVMGSVGGFRGLATPRRLRKPHALSLRLPRWPGTPKGFSLAGVSS